MSVGLNIGSDVFSVPWLVNVDIRFEVKPNVVMDIKRLGFPDKIASEINLGNIVEHLPVEDIPAALAECHRVMEDNAVLYITIPLIDVAQECYERGEISLGALEHIIRGESEGFNSHKTEFRRGDIEKILQENGFRTEPLDLVPFPYLVVSDVTNPKVDPWQYGVKAFKI